MKTKFNIFLLILISFTLMGCPAGKFYRYTFIGVTTNQGNFGETRIAYNKSTELQIECGNYIQFIRPKKRGLLARVKVISETQDKKELFIKAIVSSKYGEFKRIPPFDPNLYLLRDTIGILYYDISLKDLSHKKIDKSVQNDTISIVLQNDKKLIFVKRVLPDF